MARRRSNAEIAEVEAIYDRTADLARGISSRVNPDDVDVDFIGVRASGYSGVRADFRREVASDIVVSYTTKDPDVAERVARAIRSALEKVD